MSETLNGDAPGVIDLIKTLHDRIRALEEALHAATDELALRAEVEVIVAHEIRTPLTVVLGVLETIASGLLSRTDCEPLVAAGLRHSRNVRATVEDLMALPTCIHVSVSPARSSRWSISQRSSPT